MDTTALLYWIAEREAIHRRREAAATPDLTKDSIFQDWSFTNVRREDDRGTLWVLHNWLLPHADDRDTRFAPVIYRFVNLPETATESGRPVPCDPDRFLAVRAARTARGDRLEGPAYMIRADNTSKGRPKAEYLVAKVFSPLWRARDRMRPTKGGTLAQYFTRLGDFHGMGGGFMPTQIIGDLR